MNDLELDFSRSLKVKCNSAVGPISTALPNSALLQYKVSKYDIDFDPKVKSNGAF